MRSERNANPIAIAAVPANGRPGSVTPNAMAITAPSDAPLETPSVPPSASGFFNNPCIAAPQMPRALLAALEAMGRYRVDAITPAATSPCEFLLAAGTERPGMPMIEGWKPVARVQRPTDRNDFTLVYRRADLAQPAR